MLVPFYILFMLIRNFVFDYSVFDVVFVFRILQVDISHFVSKITYVHVWKCYELRYCIEIGWNSNLLHLSRTPYMASLHHKVFLSVTIVYKGVLRVGSRYISTLNKHSQNVLLNFRVRYSKPLRNRISFHMIDITNHLSLCHREFDPYIFRPLPLAFWIV